MVTGCIIQARMTSTRLPGKVLKTLDFSTGSSILDSVLNRVESLQTVDKIVVACTTSAADDRLAEYVSSRNIAVFRGSEFNVLDRFLRAARQFEMDRIIRITADCPFIDPSVMDDLISLFSAGKYDYASNAVTRTFPHGLDCEMFTMEALSLAADKADHESDREHVTRYMYTHPDEFRIGSLTRPDGVDLSDIRITVDTEDDYLLACVLNDLLPKDGVYGYEEIIRLFEEKPYLRRINRRSAQKKIVRTIEDEYNEAVDMLQLQELPNAALLVQNALGRKVPDLEG